MPRPLRDPHLHRFRLQEVVCSCSSGSSPGRRGSRKARRGGLGLYAPPPNTFCSPIALIQANIALPTPQRAHSKPFCWCVTRFNAESSPPGRAQTPSSTPTASYCRTCCRSGGVDGFLSRPDLSSVTSIALIRGQRTGQNGDMVDEDDILEQDSARNGPLCTLEHQETRPMDVDINPILTPTNNLTKGMRLLYRGEQSAAVAHTP